MNVLNKATLHAYAASLKLGTDQNSLVQALQSAGCPSTHILQWIENPESMPVTYSASILRRVGVLQATETEVVVEPTETTQQAAEPVEPPTPVPVEPQSPLANELPEVDSTPESTEESASEGDSEEPGEDVTAEDSEAADIDPVHE